ncbi:Fucosyltransferase N-terminal [Trinorchestia longiramus]|nr:Fucosyltransferase N-terminal [Trinorchestia longiramus]
MSLLKFSFRRLCKTQRLIALFLVSILVWLSFLFIWGENPLTPLQGPSFSGSAPHGPPKVSGIENIVSDFHGLLPPSSLRRGPVPVVLDLNEAKPDDENVAREVIDTKDNVAIKVDEKGAFDDNAAREEQSAEAWVAKKNNIARGDEKFKSLNQDQEESFHQLPEHQKAPPEDKFGDYNWRNGPLKSKIVDEKLNSLNQIQEDSGHQIPEPPEQVFGIYTDVKKGNTKIKMEEKNSKTSKLLNQDQEESFHQLPDHQKEPPEEKYGSYNNWRNLTLKEINRLSVLGRRMFLNEKVGHEQNKMFTIHIWKYKKFIERRIFKSESSKPFDPFESCSVSNCKITSEDEDMKYADAVLFHLHRINQPPRDVTRSPGQLWVWMSDESPYNVFMAAKDKVLSHYNGFFNWSMTYRMDSDVPVPYGRTVPLPKDQYLEKIDNYYAMKEKDIAILGSNCGGLNGRYSYIAELKKYISVDVYGRCGTLKCEGHFFSDCETLNSYKFYLAFENTNCDDYVTEKVWWNAYHKGAVPVVMGSLKANYEKLLPPNSFIHVDDYDSPQQLAHYLQFLLDHSDEYQKYHLWRRRYRVLNEHGYFQSPVYHMCRLCEALNYNTVQDQHADLEPFFARDQHCYAAKWRPRKL